MSLPIHPISLGPDTTVKNSRGIERLWVYFHRFIRHTDIPVDIRVGGKSARWMANLGVPRPLYKHECNFFVRPFVKGIHCAKLKYSKNQQIISYWFKLKSCSKHHCITENTIVLRSHNQNVLKEQAIFKSSMLS